jgi:neutral ceramidase
MSNVIKNPSLLSAFVFMFGLGPADAAEPASTWKAGVARVDTTPSAPVRMAGYGSRTSPSEGVAHPLAAKALALADARGHKVVMVTCDIIGFRRSFTNRVKDRVKDKFGLPREDVILFASHNHAGPALIEPAESGLVNVPARDGFQNNIDYTKDLEKKLVDLVAAALARMEPASLSYGLGRAHFALNRREPTANGIKLGKNPAGPTDESVPILRVQSTGGKALAIAFGYACHNTTLRPDMMKIAADFAGYAQDRIEADNPGATALFVTGCAGDADPHPFGTLAMAKDHGDELSEAVKLVLDHPTWMTTLTGPVRTAFTETTIRFGGPTDRASYERLLNDPNSGRKNHAKRMIETLDQGRPIRTEYPYYAVHALTLGDQLTLLALSGEVVVDYAIRLQKELGGVGRTLWMAAYANDVVGYIPSVRVLKEGGYEAGDAYFGSTWPLPLADDVESIVVNAATDVVKKVRQE